MNVAGSGYCMNCSDQVQAGAPRYACPDCEALSCVACSAKYRHCGDCGAELVPVGCQDPEAHGDSADSAAPTGMLVGPSKRLAAKAIFATTLIAVAAIVAMPVILGAIGSSANY